LLFTAASPSDWRPLDPDETLVIETSKGRIVVEMHPELAPKAVARVKLLSREGVYDGLLFHRVIEGFVDQTGNPNNHDGGGSAHPNLPAEFTATLPANALDAVATQGSNGLGGYIGALPVVGEPARGARDGLRVWGAYCPGVAGMGRQADPSTANSEIFFMRDASRRLDHDYAVWGRVVSGLDVVRAIAVGEPPEHPDKMIRVRVMADLAAADRPNIEILAPSSPLFRAELDRLKTREGANFSLCDMPISTRKASGDAT